MKHPYCSKHSSHFCPCVRPHLYRPPFSRAYEAFAPQEWDKAIEEERQKRMRLWATADARKKLGP